MAAHLSMVNKVADHLSVILFTNENRGKVKMVAVVNISPVWFIGGPSK